jgi:hypothetical protein
MVAGHSVRTIELAAEFYGLESIQRAAAAFSQYATVTIEPGSTRHCVRVEPLGSRNADAICRELANWVLADRASAVAA